MDTSFLAVKPRDRFELFDKSCLYAMAGVDEEFTTIEECARRSATSLTAFRPDCRTGGWLDAMTVDSTIAPDEDLPEPDEDEPDEDEPNEDEPDEDGPDEDDGIEPSLERGGVEGDDLVRAERSTAMAANELS